MEPNIHTERNSSSNIVLEDVCQPGGNPSRDIPLSHSKEPALQFNGHTTEWKHSTKSLTRNDAFVVGCICLTELCETLTYFSIIANLVLFCTTQLNMSSSEATVVTLVFSGSVNIMPVFGGFVADAWLGKFNTILLACLINILGLFSLTCTAIDYVTSFGSHHDMSSDERKGYFFTALVFLVLGMGGIKANLGPFGALQIEHLGTRTVQSFFNWFYWFRNIAAVISFSGVAYIQQEHRFDYGFMIPLICMVFALAVFVLARSKYKDPGPEGSMLGKTISYCIAKFTGSISQRVRGKDYENKLIIGIKRILRVLPVFGLIIVFWAVYSQMSTSLFLQSARMDIAIGKTELPAAMLNSFNAIFIVVLIPVMDGIIYPLLERNGRGPTNLQRIGFGMLLAMCAMVYAGALEIVRKNDIVKHGYIQQTLSVDTFNASRISMFAQIPQFALIGTSEVFTAVSGLEFAYTQAPPSMQGLFMGIFFLTAGLGMYLASLIVTIVKSWKTSDASDWYPADPNHGHMEYMLFLLAGLTFANLLLFVLATRWYKRKKLTLLENMECDPDETSD